MATGSYLTPIYSRSQSEVQGDLHKTCRYIVNEKTDDLLRYVHSLSITWHSSFSESSGSMACEQRSITFQGCSIDAAGLDLSPQRYLTRTGRLSLDKQKAEQDGFALLSVTQIYVLVNSQTLLIFVKLSIFWYSDRFSRAIDNGPRNSEP
ncbi:hypothetical protein TNCV_2517611 [Trichonephila clavipes]|nr:hypothetical protein TNCV_2517611 [Trichonephila clavipes]